MLAQRVTGLCFFESLFFAEDITQVVLRLREPGVECNCTFAMSPGFFQISFPFVEDAQVIMRLGEIGPERNGAPVMLFSIFGSSLFSKDVPKVVICLGVVVVMRSEQ